MSNFRALEGRNETKDAFEAFFIGYFVILIILSILIGKFSNSGLLTVLLLLGWLFFIVYFIIIIFIEFSGKGIGTLNRLDRYVKISSSRNSSLSRSDSHIIVQYEPPKGINSAEAGLLLHRYASSIEYFSLLYLWSSKGIIAIKSEVIDGNESIILHKICDISPKFPIYQKRFFNNLFCNGDDCKLTELSEIHGYYDLYDLEKFGAYKGWFKINKILWFRLPLTMKAFPYYFLVTIFSFLLFGILKTFWFYIFLYFLYYLFKKFRRLKRTDKGDKLVEHLLGFRKFVLSCDEKKLESLLKEDPLYYDEILSYAVVFGIETDLLKKLIPVLDKDIIPGDGTYGEWKSIGKFNS